MLIYRDFTFDSAHVLSDFSKDHPYGKIHGHSFRARIWIEGEINETNMLIDLGEVEKECLKIKCILDHNILNNIKGLDKPTLESLSIFIFKKLIKVFPNLKTVEVHRDQSGEGCIYHGC
tara:strand:- start:400 stop:756 length:357 start_codon:yes stop_codon:yes gene_type:complete